MVKKKTSKYKYIHCNPYKRGVSVFIGDCESLKKWARKFYNRPDERDLIEQLEEYCNENRYIKNNVCASTYESSVCGHQLIHLPKFSFKCDVTEISNLSHEVLHAVLAILDYVGVEYVRNGTHETYAYLHEYILKEALTEKGYKNV